MIEAAISILVAVITHSNFSQLMVLCKHMVFVVSGLRVSLGIALYQYSIVKLRTLDSLQPSVRCFANRFGPS